MLIFTDIFTDKHWRRWLEMFRRPLKDIATSTLLVISLSNIGIKIECKRCTMVSCSNPQATVSISLILNAWSMIASPIKLPHLLNWSDDCGGNGLTARDRLSVAGLKQVAWYITYYVICGSGLKQVGQYPLFETLGHLSWEKFSFWRFHLLRRLW